MKLFENIPRKLIYIVIAFFVIHFVLQFSFLMLEFSAAMAHFDNLDKPGNLESENLKLEEKSEIYGKIYTVLSFPLLFLIVRIPGSVHWPLYGFLGYIPWILNSALWSFGFYFLIRDRFKK